jgi:hypothetical protein
MTDDPATPTTRHEQLRHTAQHLLRTDATPCEPNWRDNPAELDRLCDAGARDLHGNTATQTRRIATVTASEEYL